MKLLVTGANGFLGRAIVARAVAGGHDVVAVVRPGKQLADELVGPAVSVVETDLRASGEWTAAVGAIDVVVHAAAAAGGARAEQLANTVVATERFLDSLDDAPPRQFVLVSSFSVYDFHSLPRGAPLDEGASLEPRPGDRDAYTESKLIQERLVRTWCTSRGVPCVVLRPGAVVGPGKDWGHGAAFTVGRFAFVVAPRGRFRLVSVGNCADAVVRAAELEADGVEIVNVVDDDLPTHAEYFRRCRRAGATGLVMVPVPWVLLHGVGRVLRTIGERVFDGRLRTPELLDAGRQEARWKPLRYPNEHARRVLGWRSTDDLDDVVRLAVGAPGQVGRG